MHADFMVINSATPPTVVVDHEASAAYVRFKRARVAKTVTRPRRNVHVAVDLDRKGDVIGIEIIGAKVIEIAKILSQAAVRTPNVDYSRARFVSASMVGREEVPA